MVGGLAASNLWYNPHIMRKSILTALAVAIIAGCGKDDGSADFEKGVAAHAARDLRAAVGFFGSAAKKNPTNFTARIKLALANIDLGEMPSARDAVESALAIEPQSAEARLVDGQIAFYTRDYSRARKDFNAVAEAGRLPPAIRSQALSELAVAEISENNFDMARLALWRAVRLDRKNAAAWYHLGHLSRDTYRFENAALEQFEMAGRLIKDPERAKAIAHSVIPALRESLRAKMASKPRASTRDPATAAKLVAEGEALQKRDPKRASAKFSEAYSKDPLSYAAAWNYAKATSASAKTDSSVDKALAAFQDAIDVRPNSQELYRTAAEAARRHGRNMQAAKFLNQALAHEFENKATLKIYVQVLRRLGRASEAKLYEAYLKEL